MQRVNISPSTTDRMMDRLLGIVNAPDTEWTLEQPDVKPLTIYPDSGVVEAVFRVHVDRKTLRDWCTDAIRLDSGR